MGRDGGNWWVSLAVLATGFPAFDSPRLFTQWSNLTWKDVRVADFDGDGRDDITGRFNGNWWVAESTGAGGSAAITTLWATWAELAWQSVGAIDATGPPSGTGSGCGASFAGGASPSGPATLLATATRCDDETLKTFWSKSNKDEDFAARLAAG